ncbi:FAD-dependent oxidoreductase [Rhizobium mesosinicum]|nr:FAD-dependent oxidoreductase [Rhizobium mesosinicum]
MKVAVVGSGPSGFYAVEALFAANQDIDVDLYERLPVPFGLVRHGVAPDHPRLKSVADVFERIAQTPRLGFFGNIEIGRDVLVDELCDHYDAVLLAIGASDDRKLGIPGEDLPGIHSANAFVGWYNGHPDYQDTHFDLSQDRAIVVGLGNVALDVCRILLKPTEALSGTDITSSALEALAASKIKEVVLVGRRGPVEAKFSPKELREVTEIPEVGVHLDLHDLEVDQPVTPGSVSAKNLEILKSASTSRHGTKVCAIKFYHSPEEITGNHRAERMRFVKRRGSADGNSEQVEIPAGLIIRSVGYRGELVKGLPFDDNTGTIPNVDGRVTGVASPVYVAGWIKRGATGIIGTNRACSVATVDRLLKDMKDMPRRAKRGAPAIAEILSSRSAYASSYGHWTRLNELEQENGQIRGKPREKFTRVEEMLAAMNRS